MHAERTADPPIRPAIGIPHGAVRVGWPVLASCVLLALLPQPVRPAPIVMTPDMLAGSRALAATPQRPLDRLARRQLESILKRSGALEYVNASELRDLWHE